MVCAAGVAAALGSAIAGWPVGEPERTEPGYPRIPFVRYEDPQGRFAVSYPRSWQRVPSSDPQVALLVLAGRGSRDSMLVRVVPRPESLNPSNLAQAEKITDALVSSSDVRTRLSVRLTLDGLPGLYYLYKFGKPGTPSYGIHAHYFLFGKSKMYVIVFQALPDDHYVDLAPIWDRITRSFQVPQAAVPEVSPQTKNPASAPSAAPGRGG